MFYNILSQTNKTQFLKSMCKLNFIVTTIIWCSSGHSLVSEHSVCQISQSRTYQPRSLTCTEKLYNKENDKRNKNKKLTDSMWHFNSLFIYHQHVFNIKGKYLNNGFREATVAAHQSGRFYKTNNLKFNVLQWERYSHEYYAKYSWQLSTFPGVDVPACSPKGQTM